MLRYGKNRPHIRQAKKRRRPRCAKRKKGKDDEGEIGFEQTDSETWKALQVEQVKHVANVHWDEAVEDSRDKETISEGKWLLAWVDADKRKWS